MKTAVEWLIEKLSNYDLEMISLFKDEINQALEKEKEQIIDAYEDGKQNGIESITNVNKYIIGEYYYNQTYKPETI